MENSKAPQSNQEFDSKYANKVLVLFAVLTAFVLYLDTMLIPSLPKIATEYNVSIAQASLVIAIYTVVGTAVVPVIGKLGDIYGKKRILNYGLIAYVITVTSTSFAPNFTYLLVSRAVQGIGPKYPSQN